MPENKLLLVRLKQELYAIPIAWIEEVLPDLPIEPLPACPEYVRGVVFVRGHLIPVLDAARRMGIQEHCRQEGCNIVCFRIGERLVGLEFDEALDLIELRQDSILSRADVSGKEDFLSGVVEHHGRVIRLLDPEALISAESIRAETHERDSAKVP